jgi:hypothetical protein
MMANPESWRRMDWRFPRLTIVPICLQIQANEASYPKGNENQALAQSDLHTGARTMEGRIETSPRSSQNIGKKSSRKEKETNLRLLNHSVVDYLRSSMEVPFTNRRNSSPARDRASVRIGFYLTTANSFQTGIAHVQRSSAHLAKRAPPSRSPFDIGIHFRSC